MGDFENQLRKLQLTMLEMLMLVDKICKENDIQYSLCSGTLLGAVRHKGFIPWDDDLDIRMTRENYDKFLEVWDKLQPEGYLLQNKENSPRFPSSFSKIRKCHTTFLQFESERGAHHTGIFVDIFPLDRIPRNRIKKCIFYISCLKYQIYTRDKSHLNSNALVNLCAAILNSVTTFNHRMNHIGWCGVLRRRYLSAILAEAELSSRPFSAAMCSALAQPSALSLSSATTA